MLKGFERHFFSAKWLARINDGSSKFSLPSELEKNEKLQTFWKGLKVAPLKINKKHKVEIT